MKIANNSDIKYKIKHGRKIVENKRKSAKNKKRG